MAAKSDIEAGSAFVRLYTKGMDTVLTQFRSFGGLLAGIGGTLTGIGLGIVAPLAGAVAHFISVGGALDDMAHRTGLARTKLSQLAFAASLVGKTVEDVEAAVKGMVKRGFDPAKFDEIAKKIGAVDDAAVRGRLSMHYFGKAGFELLQLFEEWEQIQARIKDLGIGLSDADIRLADQLGDALTEVKALISQITAKLGASLAPVLMPILDAVTSIVGTFGKWADQNKELVPVIAGIGLAFIAVGAAILAIIGPLSTVLAIGESLVVIGTFLAGLSAPVLIVAAIVAGFVALAAVIAAALTVWILFTDSGKQFWQGFQAGLVEYLSKWRSTWDVIKSTFAGVSDAIKASNIELAWQIVILGMRATFLEFIAEVSRELKDLGLDGAVVKKVGTNSASRAEARAKEARDELDALRKQAADEASKVPDKKPGTGGELINVLTGFSSGALTRGTQLVGPEVNRAAEMLNTTKAMLAGIVATKALLASIDRKTGPVVATP